MPFLAALYPFFNLYSILAEAPAVLLGSGMKNANMSLADMDFIEVNEAFAAQVLANERVLEWDRDKLNVHGGAIALGHPTGISGARILLTLYHVLRIHDGETGIAAICGGGGVSTAMIIPIASRSLTHSYRDAG